MIMAALGLMFFLGEFEEGMRAQGGCSIAFSISLTLHIKMRGCFFVLVFLMV